MKPFFSFLLLFCTTFLIADMRPPHEEGNIDQKQASSWFWVRDNHNFITEKISVLFPNTPQFMNGTDWKGSYAYDNEFYYSFWGYYPPDCRTNLTAVFEDLLQHYSHCPYTLLAYTIHPPYCDELGYSVNMMDYTVYYQDPECCFNNLVIKGRTVVTPYNIYTLTCEMPEESVDRDEFNYFIKNFRIRYQ
ncbi:MAG: hypothetical protein WAM28_04820 [Chlamydiales bacterium]